MTRTGLLGFTCMLLALSGLHAQPVTYDQRQEGKVNVQVDVKDVQIVALLDSDLLGDYNYDYAVYDDADFTVKPITKKTTTAEPSTTLSINVDSSTSSSESSSSSSPAYEFSTKVSEEPILKVTTPSVTNSTASEIKIVENTTSNAVKREEDNSTAKLIDLSSTTTASKIDNSTTKRPVNSTEARRKCPQGFQMRSGRCFRRRNLMNSIPRALMKLAPAILGKSIGGHLTTNNRS